MTPETKHIIHDIDNGFTIVGTLDSDHWMDVRVYNLLGREHTSGELLWDDKSPSSPSPTTNMEEAEVLIEGHIKWDHCSNWSFHPSDNMMLHFCELDDAERIFKIFQRIYALAADVMPNWDRE